MFGFRSGDGDKNKTPNVGGLKFAAVGRSFSPCARFNNFNRRKGKYRPQFFHGAFQFLENIQFALKEGINESAFRENVKTAAVVCQFGDDEIDTAHSRGILPRGEFEPANIRSFIFIAIDLKPNKNVYGRGVLARITRAINRRLAMPGAVFFRYEEDGTQAITLSFVHRREGKRDKTRDIIGRVSMLRGISRQTPHRGHLDILTDLTIKKRLAWMKENNKPPNFDNLLAAWLNALDTEALNLRFYRKLLEWFKHTAQTCKFPDGKNEEQVMRMITRLLFVWFVKEKGLAPPILFAESFAADMLHNHNRDSSDYYRAVLQNLFFGKTRNTARPPPLHVQTDAKGEGAPEQNVNLCACARADIRRCQNRPNNQTNRH